MVVPSEMTCTVPSFFVFRSGTPVDFMVGVLPAGLQKLKKEWPKSLPEGPSSPEKPAPRSVR